MSAYRDAEKKPPSELTLTLRTQTTFASAAAVAITCFGGFALAMRFLSVGERSLAAWIGVFAIIGGGAIMMMMKARPIIARVAHGELLVAGRTISLSRIAGVTVFETTRAESIGARRGNVALLLVGEDDEDGESVVLTGDDRLHGDCVVAAARLRAWLEEQGWRPAEERPV